jgi:4'-phosphopantetheinyl transferase EntD
MNVLAARKPIRSAISASLPALFSGSVRLAWGSDQAGLDALFPAEAAIIARAVPARQREFAAGRLLARQVLARFGVPAAPLLRGRSGEPLWPPGFVGSITHTAGFCAVAVAPRALVRSIGIDTEPDEPLDPDLWPEVCTAPELAWLSARPERCRGLLARVLFSAKESAYKCQYPLTGALLDFQAASVNVDAHRGAFDLTFEVDAGAEVPAGTRWHGRFVRQAGFLVTAIELTNSSAAGSNPSDST